MNSARAEELRLIFPSRLRLATVDLFGTEDLRERVEVLLGFDDVLRGRVDKTAGNETMTASSAPSRTTAAKEQ
jgi:hypothetical protein